MASEISPIYLLPTPHGRFLPALPVCPLPGTHWHSRQGNKALCSFPTSSHPDAMGCFFFFHLYWNLLSAQPVLCIPTRTVLGFVSKSKFQRLGTLVSQSLTTYDLGDLGDLGESILNKPPHSQHEDNAYVTGSSNFNLGLKPSAGWMGPGTWDPGSSRVNNFRQSLFMVWTSETLKFQNQR